jgi:VIT1/CCC1 family predicted Fe2+/Mn2+ transporter
LAAEGEEPQNLAQAITEISERASLLVREEIELAKAEISSKLVRLLTGAAVGIAGGMFIVVAALFVLIGLAYLFWYEFFPRDEVFWGFFVVAGGLVLMGCLSGLIAAKALRRATPPTPNMAIDEARKIREAVAAKDADA